MRRMIAVLAAALSLCGCGGSSTSSGDGGGGGGGGGGACPISAGTYVTHYSYVSGGAMCMQNIPPDSPYTTDGGTSISTGVDAGSSCPLVQNGCSYSLSCNSSFGDSGSFQLMEMFTVGSNGSVSGTYSSTFTFSFGGQTTTQACAYSFTATKQ